MRHPALAQSAGSDALVWERAAARHHDFTSCIPPLYLPSMEKSVIKHPAEEMTAREHMIALQDQFSAKELLSLRMEWTFFDKDASNTIDRGEFRLIINSLGGHHVSDEKLDELMELVDTDGSGEIDWVEYLELMLKLKHCSLVKGTEFMKRPPLILVVMPSFMTFKFLRDLFKRTARKLMCELDLHFAPGGYEALNMIGRLPPGQEYAVCLVQERMSPISGPMFVEQMHQDFFWTPTTYMLTTQRDVSTVNYDGVVRAYNALEITTQDVEQIICQHCLIPTKRKNGNSLAVSVATKRAVVAAAAGTPGVKVRIGNKGISFKPNPPRKPSNFARNRYIRPTRKASPRAVHNVLKSLGGEAPRHSAVRQRHGAFLPQENKSTTGPTAPSLVPRLTLRLGDVQPLSFKVISKTPRAARPSLADLRSRCMRGSSTAR